MAKDMKKKAGRPVGRIIKQHVSVDLHPLHDEGHYRQSWNLFRNGFAASFQAVTGLPAGLLRGEHRRKLEEAVKAEYPLLRKSALRMFFEGMLTGDNGPLQTIPVGTRKRLETIMGFLDILETMVYAEGVKRLSELDQIVAPKTAYRPLMGGKNVSQEAAKRILREQKAGGSAQGGGGEPDGDDVGDGEVDSGLGGLLDEFGGMTGDDDPDGDIARVESLAADELENDRLI